MLPLFFISLLDFSSLPTGTSSRAILGIWDKIWFSFLLSFTWSSLILSIFLDKSFDLYTGGLPIFWTRERIYDSSVVKEENCREPYRDLDCADFQEKYSSNIYKFNPPEIVSPKSKTKIVSIVLLSTDKSLINY